MVYKQLRQPRPLAELNLLCDVPALMAAGDDGACRRALSSSAWPAAAVVGPDDATVAVGALMPRAPAQFWLRHRDAPTASPLSATWQETPTACPWPTG